MFSSLVFRAGFTEIRGARHDDRVVRERIDQHEFEMDPMDVDMVRDAVELAQPSIEAVQRDPVADRDHDVRQCLNLRMA
jgi:hypothetical protein